MDAPNVKVVKLNSSVTPAVTTSQSVPNAPAATVTTSQSVPNASVVSASPSFFEPTPPPSEPPSESDVGSEVASDSDVASSTEVTSDSDVVSSDGESESEVESDAETDDASSVASSVAPSTTDTIQQLSSDPLFLVLSQFFMSGDHSVTDILERISRHLAGIHNTMKKHYKLATSLDLKKKKHHAKSTGHKK